MQAELSSEDVSIFTNSSLPLKIIPKWEFLREKNYAAKYSQEFKFCSRQPPRNLKFQSLKFFSQAPPKFFSFNSRFNTQVPKEFSTLKNNSWLLQPGSPKSSPSRSKLSCWESPRSPQKIRWAINMGSIAIMIFFNRVIVIGKVQNTT